MTALPRWMKTAALAVALAMPLAASAQEPARTVAGVAYPAQAGVGGQTLQLNGAGIRYKAIFKVYTAGLYLEKPAASLQEIAALPGPKRVSVTMLREIDSAELVPGQGAQVFVKGQAQGAPFQEPEFFQALLGIWLGPHPADEQLKKALLGS
jgi:hypothetical protein